MTVTLYEKKQNLGTLGAQLKKVNEEIERIPPIKALTFGTIRIFGKSLQHVKGTSRT